jgi:hypothetical protein
MYQRIELDLVTCVADLDVASDMYKDEHGFRPRWMTYAQLGRYYCQRAHPQSSIRAYHKHLEILRNRCVATFNTQMADQLSQLF